MKRVLIAAIVLLSAVSLSAGRKQPVIGISSSFSGTSSSVGQNYYNSVMKAGGIPVLIPLVKDESTADAIISVIDGLIMTGGEDVAPAYYGEGIWNETVEVNAPRDTSDMLILQAARKKGIPVLGICRGEQICNVFNGGSLYQDLPSQVGVAVCHRQSEKGSVPTHVIRIERGSRLHSLLQCDTIKVNSFHHQAVKTAAEGMTVSARAEDGVVEAYEGKNILCVQFHPEAFVNAGNDRFLPIFRDLVKKSGKKAGKK